METKRGRPPKPTDELQTERIELRVTSAERQSYDAAAEKAGKSLSAWIRERLAAAARRQ
jgi:uncharacterized protein (DUF1778 family)